MSSDGFVLNYLLDLVIGLEIMLTWVLGRLCRAVLYSSAKTLYLEAIRISFHALSLIISFFKKL